MLYVLCMVNVYVYQERRYEMSSQKQNIREALKDRDLDVKSSNQVKEKKENWNNVIIKWRKKLIIFIIFFENE